MEQIENKYAVLAVDGGGTRCRAVLCDDQGAVHGYAEAGPSNYHGTGIEEAAAVLTSLLSSLRQGEKFVVRQAVFGLAGLDTEQDRRILNGVVLDALAASGVQADNLILDNDGMTTLIGAVGHYNGVLVIAGTGSIACGIRTDGSRARAGGWGSRIGDEGSGFYIGKSAITHTLRAYDGRETGSGVTAAILQEKAMASVEELVAWVYSPEYSTDGVASLAPVICRLAEAGDVQAQRILTTAADELFQIADAVIRRLDLENKNFRLVLQGGVIERTGPLQETVIAAIRQRYPLAEPITPCYPPIGGAVLLGLAALGITDDSVLRRITDTLEAIG